MTHRPFNFGTFDSGDPLYVGASMDDGVVGFLVGLCGCDRAPARSQLAIPTVLDSAGLRLVGFDNNLPDERNEARSFNSAAASGDFPAALPTRCIELSAQRFLTMAVSWSRTRVSTR